MAYDYQMLMQALRNADAAGNVEDARKIAGILQRMQSGSETEEVPRRDVGVIESGVAGLKKMLSTQQTAIETPFGAEAAAARGVQRGRKLEEETPSQLSLEAVKKKYASEGLLSAAGEVVRQAPSFIAEQAPQLGAMFAGGRLGAMAGSTLGPVGTVVGGTAGAIAPLFLQSYGAGAERRAQEGLPQEPGKTALSAAGQAGLEYASTVIPFGGKLVGRMLGIGEKEAVNALVNPTTRAFAEESLKKTLAKGTAIGAVADIPTEVLQQMMDRWQADLPLLSPDALKEYQESAYGATLFGTAVGGAGRAAQRGEARAAVAKEEAGKAAEAQAKAAEDAAAAAKTEAERRATPEYALDVGGRFEALKQQEKELLAARGKKLAKDATDEQRAQFETQTAELQTLRDQLKALAPEYNEVKGKLPALREAQRVEKLTPEEYFAEVQGYKREEAVPAVPEAADPMKAWLEQTAEKETRKESESQALLNEVISGTEYQNQFTGAELTPEQVASALVNDPSSDMGLVAQVYNGVVKVPGFNKKKQGELRDYLQLQLNELAANRKEVQAQQKAVASEAEALQRIGEKPVPESQAATQLGLLRELEGYAGEMKPGASAEPGLQKQNYRTRAAASQEEASNALLTIQENLDKIAQGMTLDSSRPDMRKFASNTSAGLIEQAQNEKKRYIDAVMDEVANTRAAENQQPLTTDEAAKAAAQMNVALDAFINKKATDKALSRQMDVIRSRMLTWRPEPQKVSPELRRQFQTEEAKKVAEARGETAKTLEGQLRRQRDYVGGLIERALPMGTMPRDAREALSKVQDAIESGTATREVLDRAEDIASRIMRGQSVRGDVKGLDEAMRSMSQAQAPGIEGPQRSLFGGEELGFVRASATNFRKFLNSSQAAALRRVLEQAKAAAAATGKRGPYEAAQAQDKALKLKEQIENKEVDILRSIRDLTKQIREQRGEALYGPIIQRFEQQAQAFETRLAQLEEAMPEDARMSPDLDDLFNAADEIRGEIEKTRAAIQETRTRQENYEGNDALLAVADDRIVKEKAKLKELQDKLAKVDLVGEERRKVENEAKKTRAQVAVAEGELAKAKQIAARQAEEQKRRIATGEGLLKTKRTVVPVERENKKTGEKVLVLEKETGEPLRQKKTEGAYVTGEPGKGVGWAKPPKKSVPVTKERRLSLEDEVEADEPVVKAQRAGAKENLEDYAKVASTLARQANVTDIEPRPKMVRPLRVAQGKDAAARFAKADPKVEFAKQEHGAKSEQYKKALRDAEARYFAKLGEDAGYGADMLPIDQDGTAFRIGDAVENAVDADEAQAFIDKVKAKLPKNIKFVYAKDLLNAPGKFIKAMARDGLDVNTSKVKGGVLPNGTVVIIGNHHNSLIDLEKTVAHELAHYGTDTLLGKEGMDALYKALDKNKDGILGVARELGVEEDVLEAADAAAQRYEAAKERGASKEELNDILREGQTRALREMLAHVQEASVDKNFLAKAGDFIKALVGAVRAALRKMGFAELPKASTSDIYYVLRKAHQGVYNNTLGAYRNPSGETVFRRGTAAYSAAANPAFAAFNAKTGVAKDEGTNKVFSNVTGLGARTALVDRFAPLKEVASYLKNSAEAMQMMYYARMHDQRMAFTSTTATNGARMIAQDEKGNYIIKEAGTASLKDVSEQLAKVKGLGNAAAVRDAFDAYLKAHRAKRVGGKMLNFENPPTPAEIAEAISAGDAIPEFVEARKMYNEYNKGLINWLVQAGAISKELGKQLSSTDDYVPFYRVQGDDVLFEIGDRTPIVIGDVKNQPYLKELVGGKEDTKDFFTAALQNTALLTDMGLRNLATRQTAFTLQSAGLLHGKFNEATGKTKGIFKGTGPASPEVIRFKIDGVPHFARVDTDAIGVPAEMLVQGMHGTVTQMGGFVKMMAVPARFMRAMITRNPVYSVRQIVRDSTSNFLLTGGDMKPVVSALSEVQKMWAGKSEGEKALQERGVLGGQVISGTSEDMQKIMLQLVEGKPGWEKALAALDRTAMKADAASRVALYNDFRKQGLSDMEATLAALEAMNFSKRGTSGTLYKLNMMVPFLNAQIQGLNVLFEAFTGKLPYAEALKQRQKFYTRAAMMSAVTMMYAAMMEDDEAYKNANLRDRLQNWFIRIPGVEDPLKVPIPFEVGLIFKALPEAIMMAGQKDEDASEVMKALGKLAAMSSPVGVSTQPQAIKPIIEAALNKSFFTGRDIESAQEQELLPVERVRAGTSELAKLVSQATGGTVSPIMVEHFVNGYAGGMGLAIMQSANALLPADREAPAKRVSEMPIIGSLFQATDAPGQITTMYERAKRFEQVKNTFDKYVEEGRGADAQALAQRYGREIAFAEIAEDFKKDVGEFTTLEKQIRASALSAEEKQARLKEIRQAKIAIAKAFNVAALSE